MSSKLIILRGPSAAGKSSVAKLVGSSNANLIIIDHDDYRPHLTNLTTDDMLKDTLEELSQGHDVILDGILTMPKYKPLLDKLFESHPDNNFIFNFDTSFTETLRRHHTRQKSKLFGEDKMKDWYQTSQPTGYDFEITIPEEFTLEQAVNRIKEVTGLS